MSYREYKPPSHLSHIIECVWIKSGSHLLSVHSIFPDGAMDIIGAMNSNGEVERSFAIGAMTRPHHAPDDTARWVGIRFLPGWGGCALGTDAASLRDSRAELSDILLNSGRLLPLLQSVASLCANEETHSNAAAHAGANALSRFAEALRLQSGPPATVITATRYLAHHAQECSVAHAAKHCGVSRQQLARLFATHVGLTPKQFARVCRVRAMLSGMHVSALISRVSWSRAATSWGYADQSHLIADVRRVIGKTPIEWQQHAHVHPPIAPVATAPD